jgi:hypothetical protein
LVHCGSLIIRISDIDLIRVRWRRFFNILIAYLNLIRIGRWFSSCRVFPFFLVIIPDNDLVGILDNRLGFDFWGSRSNSFTITMIVYRGKLDVEVSAEPVIWLQALEDIEKWWRAEGARLDLLIKEWFIAN